MALHTYPTNSGTLLASPRVLIVFSILLALAVLTLRMTAPSDIHDQTQPKTIAYTVNIALHPTDWKRWILPLENDEFPATKPPLYNWLAVPFVAITRGHYEWAQKMPSILAFLILGGIIIITLRRIDPHTPSTPYLAFIIFTANYMFFKLAYLARPDTILTLFLIIGWIAATQLVIRNDQSIHLENPKPKQRLLQIIFWLSVALAMLAKGPVAILIPIYLIILLLWRSPDNISVSTSTAPTLRSRFHPRFIYTQIIRAARLSGAVWGLPLALLPFAFWFFLAWEINPEHVYGTLIRKEIVDRVLGLGDDPASSHSLWDFIITLPAMPGTFIIRFLPWSVFFFAALFDIFGRKRSDRNRGFPQSATAPAKLNKQLLSYKDANNQAVALRIWLISAIVSTIVPIVFFSFSIGKRGDYIAASFIPASILIAYWCNHLGLQLARKRPLLVPILATITITVLGFCAFTTNLPAQYPLGNALWDFAHVVRPIIDDKTNPMPVEFYRTGRNPVQSLLYRSQSDHPEAAALRAQSHQPFHLIVRAKYLNELQQQPWMINWNQKEIAHSTPAPGNPNSPSYQIFLYTLTPKHQ